MYIKTINKYICIIGASVILMGCASRPTQGAIYSNVKVPLTATSAGDSAKKGISSNCTSVLGLFAFGDCSVDNAKKNGNISRVTTVDYRNKNYLGIINIGRTIVTGK